MPRLTVIAAGLVMATAAAILVMGFPTWLEWVVLIQSTGANQVVIPLGYWALVGVWAWVAAAVIEAPIRQIAGRVVVIGFALHVLLLLATFAPELADRAHFSSPIYRAYAQLFSAVALASATAWGLRWMREPKTATAVEWLDVPVLCGLVLLAVTLLRASPVTAATGLILGAAGAFLRTSPIAARVVHTSRRAAADERLFLGAVFGLALALRLLYLWRIMGDPNYLETGADGPVYDELAWSIARGEGVRATFTARFPLLLLGYVWFVSLVYTVAGHSYFVLGAVQSVFGAVACLLLYGVGKPLFGVATARLASVFAAISFPLLFAAVAIGHQAIDLFLTLLVVWILVRAAAGRPWAGSLAPP